MPLVIISVILLAHYRIPKNVLIEGNEKLYGPHLMVPFKDLFILMTVYIIAIAYRNNIHVHARAMVATGIVFIEPALARLIIHLLKDGKIGYLLTIGLIYSVLVGLMIVERKEKRGRWVFPLVFGLYFFIHSLLIFKVRIGIWETFAQWFASLPLTN